MRRSRLGGPALGTSMIAFERGRDDATVRRDTDENDASCAEVVKKKLQAECIGFNTTVGAGWTRVTNSPPGVPGLAGTFAARARTQRHTQERHERPWLRCSGSYPKGPAVEDIRPPAGLGCTLS